LVPMVLRMLWVVPLREAEGKHGGDGDQGEDQGIFGKALAFPDGNASDLLDEPLRTGRTGPRGAVEKARRCGPLPCDTFPWPWKPPTPIEHLSLQTHTSYQMTAPRFRVPAVPAPTVPVPTGTEQ
jgi:hypothetical protein